jgi:hypothetical protein
MTADETPYDELDPPIVNLCKAINAIPGLWTVDSCSGHPEREQPEWYVMFRLELGDDRSPTREAWFALEYLGWFTNETELSLDMRADLGQWTVPWRRTRYVPGGSVTFRLGGDLAGDESTEPDHWATALSSWWEDYVEVVFGET